MQNFVTGAAALMFGILIVGLVFGVLFAFPVMWLWNGCLVPAIPTIKEIGWLQAWGLFILCAILFKSTGSSK